jgi:hypothetical protein
MDSYYTFDDNFASIFWKNGDRFYDHDILILLYSRTKLYYYSLSQLKNPIWKIQIKYIPLFFQHINYSLNISFK